MTNAFLTRQRMLSALRMVSVSQFSASPGEQEHLWLWGIGKLFLARLKLKLVLVG